MISTVPLTSSPMLDDPIDVVMHGGYFALPADVPLPLVVRAMADNDVHAILITATDGPVGWVTTRGLLHNHPREWAGAVAADAVTERIATVGADQTVSDAITALIASGADHILVVSDTEDIIGVVGTTDLVRHLARRRHGQEER